MKKTSKRARPTTTPTEEETAAASAVEEPAVLPSTPVADLPTTRQLLRSTTIAAAVAATLLLVAVLPAEYGVDPTGIGRLLGLTPMGEIKRSLAEEARGAHRAAPPPPVCVPAADATVAPSGAAPTTSATPPGEGRRDEVRIALRPNEGREIKLVMRKGARASYIWSADGGLTVDLHGEAPDGRPDSYKSYGKATGKRFDEGEIVADFDGIHGWFWRNRNHSEVSITLRTQGDYQDIKQSGSIAPTRPLDGTPGDHGHSH